MLRFVAALVLARSSNAAAASCPGSTQDLSTWIATGSASITSSSSALITPQQNSVSGILWSPVNAVDSSNFCVSMTVTVSGGGDGFAIFVHQSTSNPGRFQPVSVGCGSCIGISGVNKLYGFVIYDNSGWRAASVSGGSFSGSFSGKVVLYEFAMRQYEYSCD